MTWTLKLFSLTIVCVFCIHYATARDSTKSLYAILGSYNYGFNNEAYSVTGTGFFYNTISPLNNPGIGLKSNIFFSEKKNAGLSLLYSYANIGYHYTFRNFTTNRSEVDGNIKMHNILLNTLLQYKLFKWMKINYGLSHFVNIKNYFDNADIAKDIGWNNDVGRSTVNHYTIALLFGLEFKLSKRLTLDINAMRGMSNLVIINFRNDPNSIFPLKLNCTGVALNYRIR